MRTIRQTMIGMVLSVAFLAAPALADDTPKLVGMWRVVSFAIEDANTRERTNVYGEKPLGYMDVGADGHFHAWVQSNWPSSDITGLARDASYRAVFYSGKLRVVDDKIVVAISKAQHEGFFGTAPFDITWNEHVLQGDDTRSFLLTRDAIDDEILQITTSPLPNPNGAGNMIVGNVTWVRTHEWEQPSK